MALVHDGELMRCILFSSSVIGRLFSLFVLLLFITGNVTGIANALSPEQKKIFDKGISYFNLETCEVSSDADSSSQNTGVNAKTAFLYFISQGWKDFQAAGIVGNLVVESGVEPQRLQGTPPGTKTPADSFSGGSGWGIAQWTPGSKMINPVKASGKNPNDLMVQLDVIARGLEGKGPLPEKLAGDQLKTTNDFRQAAEAFQGSVNGQPYFGYERPASRTETIAERTEAARITLTKYRSLAPTAGSVSTATSVSGDCECGPGSADTTSSGALDTLLEKLASENGGQTKISVQTVSGKMKGNAGGTDQMPTRSSYKIYTAYATLRAIEDGRISWGTRIWGGKSVEETMEAMIVKSNNDAAEALRTSSRIGSAAKVTNYLQADVGLSDKTVMGTGSANNPAGSNSKSTANDFVKFLFALEKQQLPGVNDRSSYNKLVSFMKRATTDGGSAREGIAAGAQGSDVADKPGWAPAGTDPASNDVGIVYLSGKPYVIAILTDKPARWDGVAKIAKEVHEQIKESSGSNEAEDCYGGAIEGDLSGTVKNYAHASYHPPPYLERKPAYARAVEKAQSERRYVGGTVGGVEGIDCGAFVSLLLQDSGFEKDYNYGGKLAAGASNTIAQERWASENWQKINPRSTSDLQPGDVAINTQHTYIYVGDVEGFNSKIASASYSEAGNGRAPMAGKEVPADSDYNWYRKK